MGIFNRISFQEKMFFTKHMSMMISVGIPIDESLETLAKQTKSKKFSEVISDILKRIEKGDSFSKAVEAHKNLFGNVFVSLVAVGDESGTMEESLNFLADQMAKDNALRKKVQGALFYPAIIVTAVLIMGSIISFFVLPKLVDLFEDFDIELPLATKILLFFANVSQKYGIIIFPTLVISLVGAIVLARKPRFKPYFDKFILKLPMLGTFFSQAQLARLTRNMGTLIKSGLPINEAMEITSRTLSNKVFSDDLLTVLKKLEQGKSISEGLEELKHNYFPPVFTKMVGVGEKTGKLDETLLYLSDFFEDELDSLSKNLSTVIEPVLLIGIGLVVAFVALAVISPIYELTGSIR